MSIKDNKNLNGADAPEVIQTSETVKTNEQYMNEKVKIKLFKDSKKYKDDVFVSVNGENFLIQRGVEVEVPRYIKEVLDNSFKQDTETSTLIETLTQH